MYLLCIGTTYDQVFKFYAIGTNLYYRNECMNVRIDGYFSSVSKSFIWMQRNFSEHNNLRRQMFPREKKINEKIYKRDDRGDLCANINVYKRKFVVINLLL